MFLPSFGNSSKGTLELLIQLRAKEHDMLKEDDFFSKYFNPVSYPYTVKIKEHMSLSEQQE
jgi:hypothetical protein